jgi:hypothetical protein
MNNKKKFFILRFLRHQKFKDFWMEEKLKEKMQIEELIEKEILENCKTVKKTKKEIENFVERNYNEAEKRKIKFQKRINKIKDDEINIDDYMIFYGGNNSGYNNYSSNVYSERKRKQMKYNFQV